MYIHMKLIDRYDRQSLHFKGERVEWYRPTCIEELLTLKLQYPHATLVVGNTEIGKHGARVIIRINIFIALRFLLYSAHDVL